MQLTGVPINDDHGLEREADEMGARALHPRADDLRERGGPGISVL